MERSKLPAKAHNHTSINGVASRDLAGAAAFRVPFGLQMIPATLLGVCIHFFPYSPRWLAMVDRQTESLESLSRLRRLPIDDERILKEWRSVLDEVAFQRQVTERDHPGATGFKLEMWAWLDLFKRGIWKRTAAACGICFFTQVNRTAFSPD